MQRASHLRHHPLAWAIAASLTSFGALADTPASLELRSSVVQSTALDRSALETVTQTEVLDEQALVKRREATLGETLDGLPGIHANSFGPGASRPVIRGLDGPRVKVLSDGVDVLDASTISPDHAVTSEPLLAERIEVLKGPATLLYGGGAIGGVVNVLDQRVPTAVPEKGYEGSFEVRGNTAAKESAVAGGLTVGEGNFALHLEGATRDAHAYKIPGNPDRQEGAFNKNDSFAIGSSWIGERGYLGLAFSEQRNRYGLLAHEHAEGCHGDYAGWHCHDHDHGHDHDHDHDHEHATPYIVMEQQRWDLRGELNDPLPGFDRAKLRVGHTRYQHDEKEGDEVGTHFENDATEGRLELTHKPLFGGWSGVVGGQTLRRDFSATGEEAYVPPTLTRNHALFVLEEYRQGDWLYELGLRHEWQDIEARGAKDSDHRGTSISGGAIWTFVPDYSLGLSLSRSQRLPTAEELYANGAHAATRTVELGDADLDEETSYNAELTLRKFNGPVQFSLSVYRNEVDDFIYAADTGLVVGGYRKVEYRQNDAVLTGVDGQVSWQASDRVGLTLFGDHVRGKLKQGGDLPRIPADRLGVRLDQRFTPGLNGQLELYRVQRQDRLASHETETAGYNMLGAGLSYAGLWGTTDYLLYLKANNLLDEKARQHTSFIKDDVLLPGRNLTAGVRFDF